MHQFLIFLLGIELHMFRTVSLSIIRSLVLYDIYKSCPDSKDTNVLNMYSIFNLQKPHCQSIACT